MRYSGPMHRSQFAVTVGLALALGCHPVRAGAGEKERPMSELRFTVDKLSAFQKGEGQGNAEVKLQDGTVCLLNRQLPHFDVWAQLLQKSQEYGWYLYAGCDPSTQELKVLLPAASHNVELVTPDPQGDRLQVRFRKSHAIHVLKNARPKFDEMKQALDTAISSGQQVLVVTDPREMEIIDLRLAPASPSPKP